MREIKFRVWNGVKMFGPEKIQIQWLATSEMTVRVYGKQPYGYGDSFVNVDGPVLLQFTGLQDKNGKDIFEGDIVATYCPDDRDAREAGIVEWAIDSYSWNGFGTISEAFEFYRGDCEVIGNIYENPELLETEK